MAFMREKVHCFFSLKLFALMNIKSFGMLRVLFHVGVIKLNTIEISH